MLLFNLCKRFKLYINRDKETDINESQCTYSFVYLFICSVLHDSLDEQAQCENARLDNEENLHQNVCSFASILPFIAVAIHYLYGMSRNFKKE